MKRRYEKHSRWIKAAVLLALGVSCALPSAAASSPADKPPIKNVLVIILDALRADHLGIYGYPRNTSPNIDRLAREGLVFDRAIVQAGWTRPSVASYFTAVYPSVHGVTSGESIMPPNLTTMAEIFESNGYFTYGFVNNPNIDPQWGFDKGFQVYKEMNDDMIIEKVSLALSGLYLDSSIFAEKRDRFPDRLLKTIVGGNLLENHGFEEGTASWNCPPEWLTNDTAHSGEAAIHLNKDLMPHANFHRLRQRIDVNYGSDYLFGAFVRTKDLSDGVFVEILDLESEKPHPFFATGKLTGDNDWTLLWKIFQARTYDVHNDNRNKTEVEIRAGRTIAYHGGEFWIDGVFLLPIDDGLSLRPVEKLFFYLHFIDPHCPYEPPAAQVSSLRGDVSDSLVEKYDAEIKSLDNRLGVLFEGMRLRGLLDDTLIIITSDHGEAFGEHGLWKHGAEYYQDEVSRVPLIVYQPKLFPVPGRVEEPVSINVDLLPSLIELLGLKVPEGVEFQGRSIFWSADPSPYTFFYEDHFLRMVADKKWKYVGNEYTRFFQDREIRAVALPGGKVRLKMPSSTGIPTVNCGSVSELKETEFYRSLEPELREGMVNLFERSENRKPALFDLQNDPQEKVDVSDSHPEICEKFQKIFRERISADRDFRLKAKIIPAKKSEITDAMKEKFRALGYMN